MYWFNNEQQDFMWEPTYNSQDKQPFGGYALDKLLKSSWEKGYTNTYKSISELKNEGSLDGKNLLIITENIAAYQHDVEAMWDFINEGGNAFIATRHFSTYFSEKFQIFAGYKYFSSIRVLLNAKQEYNTFYFCTPGLNNRNYQIPAEISSGFFSFDKVKDDTYIVAKSYFVEENSKRKDKIVMLKYKIGKGSLILSCNPLIYTNYGILNDSINMFIRSSFAFLQDKPLIRTEYYHTGSNAEEPKSRLRYLKSKKPLRWALNISIITILIFMIFTAKRKQKAIPIVKPPENRMLEFVRSITGLYIQKNNNADIILKKYTFWADNLKRNYGIDIINETHDKEFFKRLSSKTGRKVEELNNLIRYLDSLDKNSRVSDAGMMEVLTKLNEF